MQHLPKIPRVSRHALWIVALAPVVAQLIGSAFNIWYNVVHVDPLLTREQLQRFFAAINVYNLLVYPIPIAVWLGILWSLRKPIRELRLDQTLSPEVLLRARKLVINLPWWAAGISAPGWLLCIPVLLAAIRSAPGTMDSRLPLHLSLSILISALIALTHACAFVEMLSQRLLYPIFFRDTPPVNIPGTHPIRLRGRGYLWIVCVVACPIISLLLLIIAPHPETPQNQSFAIAVAVISIVYGFSSAALLLGYFVVTPVRVLRAAARKVAAGDLETHIDLMRADEFGPLASQFNQMVSELREKQRVMEIFGHHVGRETARQILASDPGLGGVEKEITVLFADIRGFTTRCASCTPQEAVTMLNGFFTEAVSVIEGHDGIVNKFLGDGLMAIFGAAQPQPDHATHAVSAGRALIQRVRLLNETPDTPALEIGVGIHTGIAVVGSIGAPHRLEYTAIGDTVNLASRVESLTKETKHPLLFTAATYAALAHPPAAEKLAPMRVKGKTDPITVYAANV